LGNPERLETIYQSAQPATARHLDLPENAERAFGKAERITIRIESAPDGPVDIQVQERRGEVHLSLRAAAPEMVARIRESLPELSERLQGEGFRSESWRPDEPARANPPAGEAASEDLTRDGRGRHYRQDANPQQFSNGRQPRDEKFAHIFEMEGEQE
jgi:hypothetical protein